MHKCSSEPVDCFSRPFEIQGECCARTLLNGHAQLGPNQFATLLQPFTDRQKSYQETRDVIYRVQPYGNGVPFTNFVL